MPVQRSSLCLSLLTSGLLLGACGDSNNGGDSAPPAGNADGILFENTGEQYARKFVPAEFTLTQPPTGFVELADCPGSSINGVDTGPFRIAEAAVFITPPDGSSFPPIIGNQAIYLLWQLDNNPQLSQLKRHAGFFGGLVPDIELTVTDGAAGPLLKHGYANVPFEFSPYQLEAELTPDSPPGPPLPNSLWHLGPHGVINTYNDIYATDQILAGIGTITIEEGTALHELFGATSVTGVAASGIGSFVNTTRLRPDILATKPPGAP
jgi:hypothetical protein